MDDLRHYRLDYAPHRVQHRLGDLGALTCAVVAGVICGAIVALVGMIGLLFMMLFWLAGPLYGGWKFRRWHVLMATIFNEIVATIPVAVWALTSEIHPDFYVQKLLTPYIAFAVFGALFAQLARVTARPEKSVKFEK